MLGAEIGETCPVYSTLSFSSRLPRPFTLPVVQEGQELVGYSGARVAEGHFWGEPAMGTRTTHRSGSPFALKVCSPSSWRSPYPSR